MQSIARLSQCALIFLLFCLPIQAFTVFLILYYFGKTLFLELVWSSVPDEPRPFRPVRIRTSDLFRSSLFVLVLPYLLLGIALFLQASSSMFAQLSKHIPYQNAAASFFVECVLQASSLISHVPFAQFRNFDHIRFFPPELLNPTRAMKNLSIHRVPQSRKFRMGILLRWLKVQAWATTAPASQLRTNIKMTPTRNVSGEQSSKVSTMLKSLRFAAMPPGGCMPYLPLIFELI